MWLFLLLLLYVADAHTILFSSLVTRRFIAFIFHLLSFHFSFYCMLWFSALYFFTVLFAIKILFIYLISDVFLLRKHNDSWIMKRSAEFFSLLFHRLSLFFHIFFPLLISKVHLKNGIVLLHFIVGFGMFRFQLLILMRLCIQCALRRKKEWERDVQEDSFAKACVLIIIS